MIFPWRTAPAPMTLSTTTVIFEAEHGASEAGPPSPEALALRERALALRLEAHHLVEREKVQPHRRIGRNNFV